MPTEADTCRSLITPKLQAAGWDNDSHSIAEQRSFTDGRIIVRGRSLGAAPACVTTMGPSSSRRKIDQHGKTISFEGETAEEPKDNNVKVREEAIIDPLDQIIDGDPVERREIYFDGGQGEIAAELVHELDADGKQLRVVKLTDYTAEKVRTLSKSPDDLCTRWADVSKRIDFAAVAAQAGQPDADPFDLLCHITFNAPVLTRRQRADRVKKKQATMFNYLVPEAREILDDLLEKYASDGDLQFTLPDVLKVPPISEHGNVNEIIGKFGGPTELRTAVNKLQELLYAK